ncbi:MAG: hypothetical protein R2991_13650 [Thermoanaerobaculia bacterium]
MSGPASTPPAASPRARRPAAPLLLGLTAVALALGLTWMKAGGAPHEPATFWTDYLLAGLGVAFAVLLHAADRRHGARRLWAAALGAIAAGAALGGSSHALGGAEEVDWLWNATMISIGAAACLLGLAATRAFVRSPARRRASAGLLCLIFLVYVWWVLRHPDFQWAVLDYGATLTVLLGASAVLWWRRREPSTPWTAAAILVSFLAAAIQQLELAPHPRFNHNDLYHLVQAVGLWLFYRAGRLLPDAVGREP